MFILTSSPRRTSLKLPVGEVMCLPSFRVPAVYPGESKYQKTFAFNLKNCSKRPWIGALVAGL